MKQENGKASEPGKAKRRTLDALGLLALLLFNFAVLAGFGWTALRVLRTNWALAQEPSCGIVLERLKRPLDGG